MAAGDIKQGLGPASQAITITLASLANGSARECTAIDNSINLFLDAELYLGILVGTVSGNEQNIKVWFYGSEDGTNYTDNATGVNAALTMRSPTNLLGPRNINTPASSITYNYYLASVASAFGGRLPTKWGFVIENDSGVALNSTEGNHTKEYRGVFAKVEQ